MSISLERKTIFLYPDIDETDNDSFFEIQTLVTKLTTIVKLSNENIQDILSSGVFSKIKCMPSVIMRCVDDISEEKHKYNSVRICIIRYNNNDYTNYYKEIIDEYNKNQSDISHLVAVYISNRDGKARFSFDESGQFDVIIESNLEHLESVLSSIMLDISLYHYFSLSNDLVFRKQFNVDKCSYIFNKYSTSEIKNTFGIENAQFNPKRKMYLPFSMKYIYSEANRTNIASKKEAISSLLDSYSLFLIECFATKIQLNKNGKIKNPYDYKDCENFPYVQQIVEKKGIEFNKTLMITYVDSTSNTRHIMIEYIDDKDVWSKIVANQIENSYKLFVILK